MRQNVVLSAVNVTDPVDGQTVAMNGCCSESKDLQLVVTALADSHCQEWTSYKGASRSCLAISACRQEGRVLAS